MPDLSHRVDVSELMDDFSINDARLERALRELRYVNRFLGGYRSIRMELKPMVIGQQRQAGDSGRSLRILDLGTGIGDIPEHLVTWGEAYGIRIWVTAVDANPATVDFARRTLDARLNPRLRERVNVQVGDARALDYPTGSFDIVTASAFLHHFDDDAAVDILREMNRLSSDGLIVNDLHRHPAAYAGIRLIALLLPVSGMFGHDGPASVKRAFKPSELHRLAGLAGLQDVRIRRRWAYRLVLSTVSADPT
jgi:SAM-dependent methyltransferase